MQCPKCKYDLRGTADAVCPECGIKVVVLPAAPMKLPYGLFYSGFILLMLYCIATHTRSISYLQGMIAAMYAGGIPDYGETENNAFHLLAMEFIMSLSLLFGLSLMAGSVLVILKRVVMHLKLCEGNS